MTAIHFIDGKWIEGNPPLMGPMDQAFWFATGVFDGARAFDGVAPDLDMHCARMLRSIGHFGLATEMSVDDLVEVALDGCARFAAGTELYIRPYFYPQKGFLVAEPASTRFVMTVLEEPIPEPTGSKVLLSSYRRPLNYSKRRLAGRPRKAVLCTVESCKGVLTIIEVLVAHQHLA